MLLTKPLPSQRSRLRAAQEQADDYKYHTNRDRIDDVSRRITDGNFDYLIHGCAPAQPPLQQRAGSGGQRARWGPASVMQSVPD